MRPLLVLFVIFVTSPLLGQYEFCAGSKGDPIYHQDFEGGNTALPSGFTTYDYVTGDPNDGQFTVSDQLGQNNGTWHPYFPETAISGGKALIVNASYDSGQFFQTSISGLCQNTTYEFSAFLMNVYDRSSEACEEGGIPVNVRFEIWDITETILLKTMSTGNVISTTAPEWENFGLTFHSQAGQDAIILKMYNNGEGGCGNDLAIDDIIFRSCGDLTTISSTEGSSEKLDICEEDLPGTIELNANPDLSVYSSHFYQWQSSSDLKTWIDIPGENSETLITDGIMTNTYFRVKVAEDPNNLSGNYCSSASSPFNVNIVETPQAPINNGDKIICGNEPYPPLVVTPEPGEWINWYDQPFGGQLLAEKSSSFYPEKEGTFYAEAVKEGFLCQPGQRTAVIFKVLPAPEISPDENRFLCEGSTISLKAGPAGMTYLWSTGQTTRSIEVSSAGDFSVEIYNSYGCKVVQKFKVDEVDLPKIKGITSRERTVTVEVEQEGEFEFSLNGRTFQRSNVFDSVNGGIYIAYMRDVFGCATVSQKFAHLVIPEFITPNNDGFNDYFELNGVSFFGASEIKIFDRYGKLLKVGNGDTFRWDGTSAGKELPADDYWYQIKIEGFDVKKGSFSLIR
ncbi:gliding motility-associated C-terminal domain-containing protein [Salinimicrobium catena]|uniref:Gliding motility-associated C-terminal domain-containing protein n=1 Tax=Salinimicrobium catena TaxID=390640 RepID=A0A1H5NF82_9FLAO|nr:T9SS type B sorting domain-containing protein [Salinimicrobium catena]SDL44723.1 gliding motility-associated C-terminal domain-containing protein [Salinimicrobium catena]SEF00130.1 gliding motility-associated C-terminal domain-containing protein [Salinimicrobium catena]